MTSIDFLYIYKGMIYQNPEDSRQAWHPRLASLASQRVKKLAGVQPRAVKFMHWLKSRN